MHASWTHIIFNSIAIFFFGLPIERAIGGRKFLILYFASGGVGGLLQMVFALCYPHIFGGSVVGICGRFRVGGSFCPVALGRTFTIFIYFFPVTMRDRTLLVLQLVLAIAGIVGSFYAPSSLANAAHLGGILTGAVIIRQISRGGFSMPSFRSSPPEYASTRPRKKLWGSVPPAEDLSADEYLSNEVDPILDKISKQGIQSLTTREREILEKARSKMTKR